MLRQTSTPRVGLKPVIAPCRDAARLMAVSYTHLDVYKRQSNIGITVLGLLYGEGDFDKTICLAANCGEDADCTAATAGALFGIIRGE